MGKTAAGDKTTTSADANIEQTFSTLQAKQQFFTSAISMSWQLALTIIIPVVAGVKLDAHFDTAPSLTLAGFFLAVAMGSVVVWNTVNGVSKLQADDEKRSLLKIRRKKRAK